MLIRDPFGVAKLLVAFDNGDGYATVRLPFVHLSASKIIKTDLFCTYYRAAPIYTMLHGLCRRRNGNHDDAYADRCGIDLLNSPQESQALQYD